MFARHEILQDLLLFIVVAVVYGSAAYVLDYWPNRVTATIRQYNFVEYIRSCFPFTVNRPRPRVNYWEHDRSNSIKLRVIRKMNELCHARAKPLSTFEKPTADQESSPLLGLPGEIIDLVLSFTFTDHEDLNNPYPFDTCYRRPGYLGPRYTNTSLLRTCQFVYTNYWYLLWTLKTHTFYLTYGDRAPQKTVSAESISHVSRLIQHFHPDAPSRRKQIANVQIFPQLYMIENGVYLGRILDIPYFQPRNITITIRHTDWWWWESDEPLQILDTSFVRNCRFPESTQCVTMELESLERRKSQVDWMANRMARDWHFTRSDDIHLVAEPKVENMQVHRWKGCATWEDSRWVRDEDDTEPNVLSYYVLKVPFRAVSQKEDPTGYERRNLIEIPQGLCCDEEVAEKTRIRSTAVNIDVGQLQRLGITNDIKASEAMRWVNDYESTSRAEPSIVNDDDEDDDNQDDEATEDEIESDSDTDLDYNDEEGENDDTGDQSISG